MIQWDLRLNSTYIRLFSVNFEQLYALLDYFLYIDIKSKIWSFNGVNNCYSSNSNTSRCCHKDPWLILRFSRRKSCKSVKNKWLIDCISHFVEIDRLHIDKDVINLLNCGIDQIDLLLRLCGHNERFSVTSTHERVQRGKYSSFFDFILSTWLILSVVWLYVLYQYDSLCVLYVCDQSLPFASINCLMSDDCSDLLVHILFISVHILFMSYQHPVYDYLLVCSCWWQWLIFV